MWLARKNQTLRIRSDNESRNVNFRSFRIEPSAHKEYVFADDLLAEEVDARAEVLGGSSGRLVDEFVVSNGEHGITLMNHQFA